ncbi:MAG: hypothetical protein AABY22_10730 [Nanoarchaeota archaeon]|mgnify:FL=1
MAEEKKDLIMKVLQEFPDEKFNITRLNQLIEISYPTLLKWVAVLQAEQKIRVDDYGNVKLIYLNKEYFEKHE